MIRIDKVLKLGDKFGNLEVVNLSPVIIDRRQQIRVRCKCGLKFYVRPDRLIERTRNCVRCSGEVRRGKCTVFAGDLCSKVYSDIKRNARIRNHEFDLSINYLWELFLKQDKKCALSGVNLNLKIGEYKGRGERKNITASLDRIDSSRGYTKDNVQWVHKWINIMKGAIHNTDFISICHLISKNNISTQDNIEPSLMKGWLPRMFTRQGNRNKKGATTSSLSNLSNNKNQERPTSIMDEDIV